MLRSYHSAAIVSTDNCVISFKKSPETHEVTAPRESGQLISKPMSNNKFTAIQDYLMLLICILAVSIRTAVRLEAKYKPTYCILVIARTIASATYSHNIP